MFYSTRHRETPEAPLASWQRTSGSIDSHPNSGPKPTIDHTTGTASGFYCHSQFYDNDDSYFSLLLYFDTTTLLPALGKGLKPFAYEKISFWYFLGTGESFLEFRSSTGGYTYTTLFADNGPSTQWRYAEVAVTESLKVKKLRFVSTITDNFGLANGRKIDIAIDDFKAHPYSPERQPTGKPSYVPSISPTLKPSPVPSSSPTPPPTLNPFPIPTISYDNLVENNDTAFMVGAAAVTLFLLTFLFFIGSWSRVRKADRAKLRLKSFVEVRLKFLRKENILDVSANVSASP